MLTRLASLLLACALMLASQRAAANPSAGTPIRPGVTYAGGARLASPEAGVSFTLPAGFQGGLPQGAELFIMGPQAGSGRILMSADRTTVAEASASMAQPIDLGDGVRLLPEVAPTTQGQRVSGRYTVLGGGQPLQAEVEAVVGRHGIGVAIIAVAPAQDMPALRSALAEVRASLSFSAPASAPAAPGAAPAQGGAFQGLVGMRLLRFYTGSGYSEKTVIELCGNGSFRRNFNASSVSSLGSGMAADGSAGRYRLQGDTLVLDYHDGSHAVHRLQLDDGKLLIDGQRWYREQGSCP